MVVAHKRVLIEMYSKSMALYGLDYADLNIASRWECTKKFIKPKG
jgi:DNA polymerase-3 subunit epsilon